MKTIETLLASNYLEDKELESELISLHRFTVLENQKSKNVVKLLTGLGVHSGLLNYPAVTQKAIRSLLFSLYHSFPKIRQTVSESLYNYLLMIEDPEEEFESED